MVRQCPRVVGVSARRRMMEGPHKKPESLSKPEKLVGPESTPSGSVQIAERCLGRDRRHLLVRECRPAPPTRRCCGLSAWSWSTTGGPSALDEQRRGSQPWPRSRQLDFADEGGDTLGSYEGGPAGFAGESVGIPHPLGLRERARRGVPERSWLADLARVRLETLPVRRRIGRILGVGDGG
jgi:hypothetical protein